MINGKTKSGIAFSIDERIKNDSRLMYLLVKMQDTSEPIEAGKAMNKLFALIFGSDENAYTFMEEVATKHNGSCPTDVMLEEITEMLNAIEAKN